MYREFVDIHSHILPKTDDGSVSMDESIQILRKMCKIGVSELFVTPHFCKRRGYTKSVGEILDVYYDLRNVCIEENIPIKLHLGTEMEYSQDGQRYIREGRVNTLSDSKYILVEFAPYVHHEEVIHCVKEITVQGLVPVLAHIERYKCVHRNIDMLYEVKSMGALLQVNIRSVCNVRLTDRKFMKTIFQRHLIDFLAGDVHRDALEIDEMQKCCAFVLKCADEEYLNSLLHTNAKKYLLSKEKL